MNVAQIILSQIRKLDRNAMMAWGAKNLVNMGQGLKFQTSGMVKWKGWVYIKYNAGTDLYDIDFFKVRGSDIKMVNQVNGVSVENLIEVIDSQVG